MAKEITTSAEFQLYLKVNNIHYDNNSVRQKTVRKTALWTFTYLGRRYEFTLNGEFVRA